MLIAQFSHIENGHLPSHNPLKAYHLFNDFKDQDFTREYLEDYINKKYPRINVSNVADRFQKAIEYINKLKKAEEGEFALPEPKAEWFKIIQLKYALTPPEQKEMSKLANEIAEELKTNEDVSIRILANRMKQNLENRFVLTTLVDSIVDILSVKYPSFVLESKERKQIQKSQN